MKKIQKLKFVLFFVIAIALLITGCENQTSVDLSSCQDKLLVHFINVGQGDSIFLQLPNGQTSLIDAGSRDKERVVVDYLNKLGIEKIDYLIATHPHEDHIGGLPSVIQNFKIGNIYMPDKTSNTVIFKELLRNIKSKDLKINIAQGGQKIINDENLKYIILAPNSKKYDETNEYSIVTKLTFGNNSFMFTGDAEEVSENEMLEKGYDLSSNVLKIGHHGGQTSTTEKFLCKVNPKYSVISVGKDNKYGHPHQKTLTRLRNDKITVLRTDEVGTIVFESNGENIKIKNKIKVKDEDEVKVDNHVKNYYIGNKNTKVYHSPVCSTLPKLENQVKFKSREEAEKNGYRPHKKCVY